MLTASLKLRPSRYEDPTHSEVVTSVMENQHGHFVLCLFQY